MHVGFLLEAKKDKLVTKLNNIDTTGFVLETKHDTDKSDLEKKISDAEKKILTQVKLLTNRFRC